MEMTLAVCILVTIVLGLLSYIFMNSEWFLVVFAKVAVVPFGLVSIAIGSMTSDLGAWGFLIALMFLLVTFDSFRQGIIQYILLRKCYPISKYKGWYKITINQAKELPHVLKKDHERKLKDEIAKRTSDWDPSYY